MPRIIKYPQGSPEWHQHRAAHYNASDAPAMLGISPYKSRTELLHEKHTGLAPEVDPQTQKRFDKGHEYEAIARPWAEEIIGDDLYPVVLAEEIEGLPLSASYDGLTMDDDPAFEHKSSNDELRQALDNDTIPEHHRVQMEQQLLICGGTRCLFMASNGEREYMRYAWYESDPALRDRLIAGWKQFDKDLTEYQPPEAEATVRGHAPENLPALHVEVRGQVVQSNLDQYKEHALAVFRGINTDLQTDEDFAHAEATSKWCKEVEGKLKAAKDHTLSQAEDIHAVLSGLDEIAEEARQTRLRLDRQIKQLKEQRRTEILENARSALRQHVEGIEALLKGPGGQAIALPDVPADFAGAMKGKKTLKTLQEAVDTELANAKIEADRIANGIRVNLQVLDVEAEGYETLFPDAGRLVMEKSEDDLRNLIRSRIAEHKEREAQREEAERRRAVEQAETESNTPPQQPDRAPPVAGKRDESGTSTAPATEGVPPRPSDDQIIAAVAASFSVSESVARDWIASMDIREAA